MTEKVVEKPTADAKPDTKPKVEKVKRYRVSPLKLFLKTTYWVLLLSFLAILFFILFQAFDTWYKHYLETKV